MTSTSRRPLSAVRRVSALFAVAAALLAGSMAALAGSATPAGATPPAQEATTTEPTADVTANTAPLGTSGQPRSIPLPNSGQAPTDSGQRGGALQEAVFFGICGVIVGGIGLVWWESRRKRRAQGRLPARR